MSHSCFATQLGLLLLAGGLSMQAGSYTVKPVRIELSARQLRTTMQIQNLGEEPTTIQAHVVAWNANGAEEVLSDNDEILLNAPIFVKPRVSSPQLAWTLQRSSDQELRLSVQNRGNAHVQIRKLAVTAGEA